MQSVEIKHRPPCFKLQSAVDQPFLQHVVAVTKADELQTARSPGSTSADFALDDDIFASFDCSHPTSR